MGFFGAHAPPPMRLASVRTLLLFLALAATAASAQVRASDARTALAFTVGAARVLGDQGFTAPSIGAEAASLRVGGAAAFSFPSGDNTARTVSLAAFVYPAGRTNPVTFLVGAEYDRLSDDGSVVAFLGPTGALSWRAVQTPAFSVIPEVRGTLAFAVAGDTYRSSGAVAGVAGNVTLRSSPAPGVQFVFVPSVSRSVVLGSFDDPAYAVGASVGTVFDL